MPTPGKAEQFALEEVVWEDHFSSTDWTTLGDIDTDSLFVTTIGYRVKETRQKLVLSQNVADAGGISNMMTILKKNIKSRTVLREAQ